MPKKNIDHIDLSETGNWNVASDYTKLKIMKWLFFADEYEIIATFGTSDMLEEYEISEEMQVMNRIKALQRLIKTLELIGKNCIFAVKSADKETLKTSLDKLKKIKKISSASYKITTDARTHKRGYKIQEEKFDNILEFLIEIKTEMNEPLNKADLIFTHREEHDPKKIKDELMKALTEIG